LLKGELRSICCEFVNTYKPGSGDGDHTHAFEIPDDPPIELIPAFDLWYNLRHEEQEVVLAQLNEEFAPFTVHLSMGRKRKSKAKTPYLAKHWPAVAVPGGNLSLKAGHHDILSMTIYTAS
jgi:hypothetical protein